MKACSPAMSTASNMKIATPSGSSAQEMTVFPGEHAELAAYERDQQVAGEQVGPQPDGERDQAQEVGEDLDRVDQKADPAPDVRHQALDVTERTVRADALVGEGTNTTSARISGKATFVSAA